MTRADDALAALSGERVLVIGIGGGGDVLGALLLAWRLRDAGAAPVLAGLTWKRTAHDPLHRPRPRSHFSGTGEGNDVVWAVSAETVIREDAPLPPPGRRHIEALLAARTDLPFAAIDVGAPLRAIREGLMDFCRARGIRACLAVDVGGDVLCRGDEPTLRSPLCDQLCLGAVAGMEGALLAVCGFGSDGELPIVALPERLVQIGEGFLGATAPDDAHLRLLAGLLADPAIRTMTESSRKLLDETQSFPEPVRADAARRLSGPPAERDACLAQCIASARQDSLRSGTRKGDFGLLTAVTLLLSPGAVWGSGRMRGWIDPEAGIAAVHAALTGRGVVTELSNAD